MLPWLSLLNPWMLGFGMALVIPWILQRYRRRPQRVVEWGAMRLLQSTDRQVAARPRAIANWLLWLRWLGLLLLAVALARPFLEFRSADGGLMASFQPTLHVIVLDGSFSMRGPGGKGRTKWGEAMEYARRVLQGLPQRDVSVVLGSEGDQRTTIERNQRAQRAAIANWGAGYGVFRGGEAASQVVGVLQTLRDAWAEVGRVSIHVVTDGEANSWSQAEVGEWKEAMSEVGFPYTLHVERIEAAEERDVWIESLAPGGNGMVGYSQRWTATIGARGGEKERSIEGQEGVSQENDAWGAGENGGLGAAWKVGWWIDGQLMASEMVRIERFPYDLEWEWTPTRTGLHRVECRISKGGSEAEGWVDAIQENNIRYAVADIRRETRLLLVEEALGEARSLQIALECTETPITVQRIVRKEVTYSDLASCDGVILCDLETMPESWGDGLKEWLSLGRTGIVSLGAASQVRSYEAMWDWGVEIGGARFKGWKGESQSAEGLAIEVYQYASPILRPFRDFPDAGLLTIPVQRYWSIPDDQRSRKHLGFSNGDGWIVERPVGRGRLYWLTTPLCMPERGTKEDVWNGMAAWPSYVPLVQGLLQEMEERAGGDGGGLIGEWFRGVMRRVGEGAAKEAEVARVRRVTFTKPNGERTEQRTIEVKGDGTWRLVPMEMPGFYVASGLEEEDWVQAVNVDSSEYAASEDVWDAEGLDWSEERGEVQRIGEERKVGYELARGMLWLVGLVFLVEALVAGWLYWGGVRRRGMLWRVGLRLLSLSSLLMMLSPWSWAEPDRSKPLFAVLLDVSRSMGHGGEEKDSTAETRWEGMRRLLKDASWESLSREYRVVPYAMAEGMERLSSDALRGRMDGEPRGEWSAIGEAVRAGLGRHRGERLSGLIVVSDGLANRGVGLMEVASEAASQKVPMYLVGVGEAPKTPDVRIQGVSMEPTIFVGDTLVAQVRLERQQSESGSVTLRWSDAKTGAMLGTRVIEWPAGNMEAVAELRWKSGEPELKRVVIEVEAVAGERNVINNRVVKEVVIRDTPLSILLVSATPSYEYRFLKHWLERTQQPANADRPAFRVEAILGDADLGYVEQDESARATPPLDRAGFEPFDVVILVDVPSSLLVTQAMQAGLVAHVSEGGGGLLWVGGPLSATSAFGQSPMASLFPMELGSKGTRFSADGFAWKWTELGQRTLHPVGEGRNAMPALPRQSWRVLVDRPKPWAMWMAEAEEGGQTYPLLLAHYVGSGRVAYQATDSTYLWHNHGGSEETYQAYWMQLLRWLARSDADRQERLPSLVMKSDRAIEGERVEFAWEAPVGASRDGATSVELEKLRWVREGNGGSVDLTIPAGMVGMERIRVPGMESGSYRLEATLSGGAKVEVAYEVEALSREEFPMAPAFETLQEVAAMTGGTFVRLEPGLGWWDIVPTGLANEGLVRLFEPERYWLWLAMALLIALTLEWYSRMKRGLP